MQSGYGESSISGVPAGYEMYLHTEADNSLSTDSYSRATAYAFFNGGFIANGSVLEISYSYSYDIYAEAIDPDAYAYNDIWAYLQVWEVSGEYAPVYSEYSHYEKELVSDFVEAYDSEAYSSSDSGTNTISIPVTPGVKYKVWLQAGESAYAGDGNAMAGARSLTFTYDFTVVPEPVSSILFVTGAATLGVSYRRKRKKTFNIFKKLS
jgi:hypothetical protein